MAAGPPLACTSRGCSIKRALNQVAVPQVRQQRPWAAQAKVACSQSNTEQLKDHMAAANGILGSLPLGWHLEIAMWAYKGNPLSSDLLLESAAQP